MCILCLFLDIYVFTLFLYFYFTSEYYPLYTISCISYFFFTKLQNISIGLQTKRYATYFSQHTTQTIISILIADRRDAFSALVAIQLVRVIEFLTVMYIYKGSTFVTVLVPQKTSREEWPSQALVEIGGVYVSISRWEPNLMTDSLTGYFKGKKIQICI